VLTVRFYAELNDHLPAPVRFREASLGGRNGQTVGTLIARQGVPLAEVDLILANGESVGPEYRLGENDRVSVYPVFESFDIGPLQRLRATPLRRPRFVLDVHLGRLSTLLRMLGIDARYSSAWSDEDLKAISRKEERVLLSRDRALIASRELVRAHLVRDQRPDDQLREVMERFQLSGCVRPFTRCLRCNATLLPTGIEDVREQLPSGVRETHRAFWRCPSCRRIYWRGSHYERMRAHLLHLTGNS